MPGYLYARAQDQWEIAGAPARSSGPDLSVTTGKWLNTNSESLGITRVISSIRDEALRLQPFGASAEGLCNWGEVKVGQVYADSVSSGRAMAFTTIYDFGFMQSHLQANVNLGLLVLAAFNTFRDGSGRSNYFSREFYRQVDASTSDWVGPAPGDHGFARAEEQVPSRAPAPLDPKLLVGSWQNTNRQSKGVAHLRVSRAGALSVFGAAQPSPVAWGEVTCEWFAKDPASTEAMAFSATYNLGFMQTHVQANVKQGVLVVAWFTQFNDDSGRSNYFSREFYYREDERES